MGVKRRQLGPLEIWALSLLGLFLCPGIDGETRDIGVADQWVRVGLVNGVTHLGLSATTPIELTDAKGTVELPPGDYDFELSDAVAARERHHLFSKTFYPGQSIEERAYLDSWRDRGYAPEVVVVGKRFVTEEGTVLDNRVHWVSIARFDAREGAVRAQKKFEADEQRTWMHAEIVALGTGVVTVRDSGGNRVAIISVPARIESAGAMTLNEGVAVQEKRLAGILEIGVGPDGRLTLVERVLVEDYLRGVLPSEMPASWPAEALKAQAVAARSEVLAHLAGKHNLEGVDFCDEVHCRAYRGSAQGDPRSDAAIRATRGEILVQGSRIAATVFSANCGGRTENNDAVWSAPPDASLRSISDTPSPVKNPKEVGIPQWIETPPRAFCDADATYFRWRRAFDVEELSAIVNERFVVGRIQSITLGERGTSGRLRSVRVSGSAGTVTIRKELAIRQAFGGLPSALFVVEPKPNRRAPKVYEFIGGGRGHGVGLCQHGARGMAAAKFMYTEILGHYYSGVRLERYR